MFKVSHVFFFFHLNYQLYLGQGLHTWDSSPSQGTVHSLTHSHSPLVRSSTGMFFQRFAETRNPEENPHGHEKNDWNRDLVDFRNKQEPWSSASLLTARERLNLLWICHFGWMFACCGSGPNADLSAACKLSELSKALPHCILWSCGCSVRHQHRPAIWILPRGNKRIDEVERH